MTQMALPKLPTLQDLWGAEQPRATSSSVYKTLMAPQAQMSSMIPSLQELMMGSQAPAVQSIREGARMNVASTQSDMMRRGLTGSDIEASAMAGARGMGEQQVGQLMAQQSNALAQYIMQAMGMDISANREQFQSLAQAIGQEIQANAEAEMFRQSMQEGRAAEGRAHLAGQQGGIMSLVGSMIQGVGGIAAARAGRPG